MVTEVAKQKQKVVGHAKNGRRNRMSIMTTRVTAWEIITTAGTQMEIREESGVSPAICLNIALR